MRRFRNRLRSMGDRLRAGSLTLEEAQPRIGGNESKVMCGSE